MICETDQDCGYFPNTAKIKALEMFIRHLAFPVQVYSPEGQLIMLNDAFLKEFSIENPESIVGRYNILQDETATDFGISGFIRQAFEGQAVVVHDHILPLYILKQRLGIKGGRPEMLFVDVSTFPVFDSLKKLIYVINMVLIKRRYKERVEIMQAIKHIESNWKRDFSIDEIARSVSLSKSYFCRLFKLHTGSTPHDYYTKCKVEKLKEALLDPNITVEQAFMCCGVMYHGHYARVFREYTGFTPSQYRTLNKQKASSKDHI